MLSIDHYSLKIHEITAPCKDLVYPVSAHMDIGRPYPLTTFERVL